MKENPPIRSKEFEDVIQRKRGDSQVNLSRLRQRKKDIESKIAHNTDGRNHLNGKKCIFNTVESNQVFVGCALRLKDRCPDSKRDLIFF